MAISGQNNIDIGGENQSAGSDTLYEAFNKIQTNFTTLFESASPFSTFTSGSGITVTANNISNTVLIENTGVLSITQGTGIAISGSNGNVTISATGGGNGGGVTSIGISSDTLDVANTPIVSSGVISIDLPIIPPGPSFAAGEYIAPTLTVDDYGRITEIANTVSVGTVTSVAITAVGDGLSVANSPITSSGAIEITNTGVTAITAGNNISISGSTGNVTIDASFPNAGTVTRIDISSNNLTVTGSPVTTDGNITIDIPDDFAISGNITANGLIANSIIQTVDIDITGNANIANANIGNISGNIEGYFDGIVGNNTPNAAYFTNAAIGNANVSSNVNVEGGVNLRNNSSVLRFINASGNTISFKTPSSASDASFYVPNSTGTIYQVLGVTANAATQTLGWKTIPVQYLTITLRDGVSTTTAPYNVVLRKYPVTTRTGAIIQVALS